MVAKNKAMVVKNRVMVAKNKPLIAKNRAMVMFVGFYGRISKLYGNVCWFLW